MTKDIYCTYLTVYSGDKLPPLYIGSTSVRKIEDGYRGSVKSKKYKQIWESELSENPHLFETQILTTHETREEALEEEMRYQIAHDVVRSPEYINMAIANKKFIYTDHTDLEYRKNKSIAAKNRWKSIEYRKNHSSGWSEERRKKQSELAKKQWKSDEYRKKNSKAVSQTWTEERRKKASETTKKYYETEENRKKTSESVKKGMKKKTEKEKNII